MSFIDVSLTTLHERPQDFSGDRKHNPFSRLRYSGASRGIAIVAWNGLFLREWLSRHGKHCCPFYHDLSNIGDSRNECRAFVPRCGRGVDSYA